LAAGQRPEFESYPADNKPIGSTNSLRATMQQVSPANSKERQLKKVAQSTILIKV
jgi:hypothetical protein